MTIFNVLSFLGGLALFLFGMTIMGEALEKAAGSKLKGILSKLTTSPLKGLLFGAGITAIIQSSSATTVMVVGFVNSGLMQLGQAIGVIMGANIGTTMTAWILSLSGISGESLWLTLLKPSSFSPVLAFIGIGMLMFSKKDKYRNFGYALLGFAVLMFGMETMSDNVKPLTNEEGFTSLLTAFSNPILGILAGTVITGIIQSSSASVGILQALCVTGAVSIGNAIPIIMGQNIGTCVTALISSIGTSTGAKRAAAAHLYFNIIGSIVGVTIFLIVRTIFQPEIFSASASQWEIAVIHTGFNVFCTLLIFPFIKGLEKLVCATVRENKNHGKEKSVLLDERMMLTPSIALENCQNLTFQMAELAQESLFLSLRLREKYDYKDEETILAMEDKIDQFEDELSTYLVRLNSKSLSQRDNSTVSKLLHDLGDLERIGDHSVNIMKTLKNMHENNLHFSDKANKELDILIKAVNETMDLTFSGLIEKDMTAAFMVEPLTEVIKGLRKTLMDKHIIRLQEGSCTLELGILLSELLNDLGRIVNHCSNLAAYQIEYSQDSYDVHAYIESVKKGTNPLFVNLYQDYSRKYALA